MPIEPTTVLVETISTSSENTSPSGVRTSTGNLLCATFYSCSDSPDSPDSPLEADSSPDSPSEPDSSPALALEPEPPPASSPSPLAAASGTTGSIVPLRKNADSGRSSCLPSRISLKPRIDSATGTYTPGTPVNCSATLNG